MFGILITAACLAITIWYFYILPFKYWRKLGVKQSKPWIFFGDSFTTIFRLINFNDFISMIYNMHPGSRCTGIYNFISPVLVLRDPELIKHITVKDFEYFTDHPSMVDPESDPLFSNALLALKGERWKEMRSTVSPTFTSSKIKSIYTLMLEVAEDFVDDLLRKKDKVIECEVKDSFSRFANDIIATTAFGVKVNSLKDPKNTFYEMGKRLSDFKGFSKMFKFLGNQAFPKLFKYLNLPIIQRDVSKYFYDVIDDTIKAREEQNIIRHDTIHLLLEARKDIREQTNSVVGETGVKKTPVRISNAEITSQSMIFFFAGFETVSTAMSFGAYELALNKDIQDRLRQEIMETQKDGKVSYDDLMQMKYMDMVVSEILRKWPPFAFLDRICTKPYTIEPESEDEQPIPILVNQKIWIPVYGIHRDPKYFPEPEKFNPERFSDENKANILPYTYIPFGVGPRNCVGNRFALMEIKVLFFNLLLNFEIAPTKKTEIPLILSKSFNQLPDEGVWLGLKCLRT